MLSIGPPCLLTFVIVKVETWASGIYISIWSRVLRPAKFVYSFGPGLNSAGPGRAGPANFMYGIGPGLKNPEYVVDKIAYSVFMCMSAYFQKSGAGRA